MDKCMSNISIRLPDGELIDIKVRSSTRANRFIISVNSQTSEFWLSKPISRSLDEARIFVERNVPWIAEQVMKLPARVQFRHGSIVPILGKEYKKGKTKLLGFFVGQAMKESKGKANPKKLNQILVNKLN